MVKQGDIIEFTDCLNIKYSCFSSRKSIFYSFVEIDYYTKTIVLIKDFFDLEYKDIALFYENYTNSKKLNDYIRKK